MKIKLDKYDIAMANAVGKEDGCSTLCNICLKDGKLVAADGYMLIVRDAEIIEGERDSEILLPGSIIKTIRTTPKRQAELVCEDANLSVSYKNEVDLPIDYDPTLTFKHCNTDTSKYPDYLPLFPKDTAKKAHIALGVGLLKRLISCLPEDGFLRMGITDDTSPLEFECVNPGRPIRGMIMPMGIDWEGFEWHRELETESDKKKEG